MYWDVGSIDGRSKSRPPPILTRRREGLSDLGHHMCFSVHYCSKRPYMSHSALSDYGCDPKFAESLPMMRLMSGSSQHMEIEAGQRAALLGRIDGGLYWDWHDPARPWQDLPGKGKDEEVCQLFSQGRMIRALLRWRELGDDTWDGFTSDMVSAMGRGRLGAQPSDRASTRKGGPVGAGRAPDPRSAQRLQVAVLGVAVARYRVAWQEMDLTSRYP